MSAAAALLSLPLPLPLPLPLLGLAPVSTRRPGQVHPSPAPSRLTVGIERIE